MIDQFSGAGPFVGAVDFGASSIRVSVVDLSRRPLEPVVVHRHQHRPVRHLDGSLRWDWETLVVEARRGLAAAMEAAPLSSIGVDTWGLDYGLLDRSGRLVAPPHSYRDERLSNWESTADRIGRRTIYDITGIQLMAGNSIFQLAAHDRTEFERTAHVLMLPELLLHDLCGVVVSERTSAGTTSLVDVRTGLWSDELLDAIDVDRAWFSDIASAGEMVGRFEGVPVHLVGGHDTASAVLAMGSNPSHRAAFLSAGTLFLVGREVEIPCTDDRCFDRNLSNEPGTYGGTRLLGNLPGMWLLEECRRIWGNSSMSEVLSLMNTDEEQSVVIDVDDVSLVAPDDMPEAVRRLAGLDMDCSNGMVVRCIVESMAEAVAASVERVALDDRLDALVVFGGASQATSMLDRIATRVNVPVQLGPIEATTLGNALSQGISIGVFTDVADARSALSSPDEGA